MDSCSLVRYHKYEGNVDWVQKKRELEAAAGHHPQAARKAMRQKIYDLDAAEAMTQIDVETAAEMTAPTKTYIDI